MEELVTLVQKTYGIAGVILLVPSVALFYFWKATTKREKELIDNASKAQDQRVKDAQGVTTLMFEQVKEQAALSKETNMALERVTTLIQESHGLITQLLTRAMNER